MYNSSKIKFIGIILLIIICICITFKVGMDIKYKNDLKDIYAERDTTFDNYNKNYSLVEDFLSVYDIVDETSYQNVKNELYDNFSLELQKQYFPTPNYKGLDLHSVKTDIIRIVGTNNDFDKENYFLIEYNLKGVNYDQNIINLIKIEQGVISKIDRIN